MDDEANSTLFVADHSEVSGREAHIAQEVDSIWLYLTAPGSKKVDTVVWLLNLPAAPEAPGQQPYRSLSAPPPLPKKHLLEGGVREVQGAAQWTIVWSPTGEAVAAILDGEPIGYVTAGSRRGSAKYASIGADSWALPWNQAAFAQLFQTTAG